MQPIPFSLGGRSFYITGQCWLQLVDLKIVGLNGFTVK